MALQVSAWATQTFFWAVRFSAIVIALACSTSLRAQGNTITWIPWAFGQASPNTIAHTILADHEHGGGNDNQPLYVCRAAYAAGVHPGKLLVGHCNISYSGQEYVLDHYEVAVQSNPSKGVWSDPGQMGPILIGGHEAGGQPLAVCRAEITYPKQWWIFTVGVVHAGDHPGKLVQGKCAVPFGGKEQMRVPFQVYYPNGFVAKPVPIHVSAGGQSCRIPPAGGCDLGGAGVWSDPGCSIGGCAPGYHPVCTQGKCTPPTYTFSSCNCVHN